jgi:hypothetical protein
MSGIWTCLRCGSFITAGQYLCTSCKRAAHRSTNEAKRHPASRFLNGDAPSSSSRLVSSASEPVATAPK